MAFAPSAQNPARSALIFLRRRIAVQRSSDTIGTIAAALAKAQAQLVNPEKSLVATGRMDRAGPNRRFAMRRSRVGWISCVRPWVSMRLLPCRRRRSI